MVTPPPLWKRAWYNFLWVVCRILSVVFFQMRVGGRERMPLGCGVLIVANHQSHLDPVLFAVACDRRLTFLARATLFKFTPFRWLIQSLEAIPLDREGIGMGGIKETLRRLKNCEVISVFAEGTRTPDGEVHPFKPGFILLARRAKVPLMPVGIDGAFTAWPRSRKFPRPAAIRIQWGNPLSPELIAALDDGQLLAEVERRVRACHAEARAALPR